VRNDIIDPAFGSAAQARSRECACNTTLQSRQLLDLAPFGNQFQAKNDEFAI